jgi:endonuclease/exonuclease/phosphatase family metal-dependent hydrolase
VPTLVTWNVAGLDEDRLDERTEASCLAVLLQDPPPDFVMLQELVRRSWLAHWTHHLHHADYDVFPADPMVTGSAYFSALAVRRGFGKAEGGLIPFPGSRMGRALIWATVTPAEGPAWKVYTGHLESERGSSAERVAQLDAVGRALLDWPGPSVFGGDTNLRVDEEDQVASLPALTDAWKAVGAKADRATWLGGKIGARFDRVYTNAIARPTAFSRFAVDPVALDEGGQAVRLSDHAGLRVTLDG